MWGTAPLHERKMLQICEGRPDCLCKRRHIVCVAQYINVAARDIQPQRKRSRYVRIERR